MKFKLIGIVVAVCGIAGCDVAINQKAKQLANDLSGFRDVQSKKLADINTSFDQSYKRSLGMLEKAKAQELRLDRDRDAQRIADQIVADSNNSLRSAFRDNLADIVTTQRNRVAEADQAIEVARKRYSDAYQKTSLALGKLDTVISELRIIGADHGKLAEFYKFVAAVDKVYRGLQDEQQKSLTAAVETNSGDTSVSKAVPAVGRAENRIRVEQMATPDSLK